MPQLVGIPTPGSPADLEQPKNQFGETDLSQAFARYLADTGRTVTDTTIEASLLRASTTSWFAVGVWAWRVRRS